MEITDVRMNLMNHTGACKAIGSISLDGCFAVRGMRVMQSKEGKYFVSFPSRERANGEYEDIAFPLNKELYNKITDATIGKFNELREQVAKEVSEKAEATYADVEAQQTAAAVAEIGRASCRERV